MFLRHCFESEARREFVPYCFAPQVNHVPSPPSLPQQKTGLIYLKKKKTKLNKLIGA